jgi:alkanesulfonate monooxygenase SsuD/methylene tetrahydromethanopterin reductase-like flavin-dependent oxidoreductase (luciferase family)
MTRGGADTLIRFGVSLVPATERLDRIHELVRKADEAGLDLVGIQDHPYQRRFLDTWSLIPTLLAETERISFLTDVANLPLRPPAVMAKAAASLDVLSGGRFERLGRRWLPRRDRGLWRSAANTGRVGGGARRGDRCDQAVVV